MLKSKFPMSNQNQSPNIKSKFDLVERTSKFGENVILFAKTLPDNPINRPLINQFIRSGTSIGANYMEADCAESKKDFKHKIAICKKESKETEHWLRMISKANPSTNMESEKLWKESHELLLIFSSIINKTNKTNDKA